MDLNFATFQEPRGVMRILHFVFSICAFATISGFTGKIHYSCTSDTDSFSYPFYLVIQRPINNTLANCTASVIGDFSSDAKFFVATGVLAMLYALAIMIVYAKFDDAYKTNSKLPLYDFIITVIFGVLWLSSSAAWANGLTGLKSVTGQTLKGCSDCQVSADSFSSLNISVIFGFLNFFLWAADLWFLYKETEWFQGAQPHSTSGV